MEALDKLVATLEKYKKNSTLVSPEDLAGKYKVPYEKLRKELHDDLLFYLQTVAFEQIVVLAEDAQWFVAKFNHLYRSLRISERIYKAAYKNYDLEAVKVVACELREAVLRLYREYMVKHTCLYAKASCFDAEKPQQPLVYNDVLNKVYEAGWRNLRPDENYVVKICEV